MFLFLQANFGQIVAPRPSRSRSNTAAQQSGGSNQPTVTVPSSYNSATGHVTEGAPTSDFITVFDSANGALLRSLPLMHRSPEELQSSSRPTSLYASVYGEATTNNPVVKIYNPNKSSHTQVPVANVNGPLRHEAYLSTGSPESNRSTKHHTDVGTAQPTQNASATAENSATRANLRVRRKLNSLEILVTKAEELQTGMQMDDEDSASSDVNPDSFSNTVRFFLAIKCLFIDNVPHVAGFD